MKKVVSWMLLAVFGFSLCYGALPVVTADAPEGDGAEVTFSDVPEDYWAYIYVTALEARDVLNGYEDGTFQPDGDVTRSEYAKFLTLGIEVPLVEVTEPTFSDIAADSWSFPYVEAVKDFFITNDDGEDTIFDGEAPASRIDVAVSLVRALGLENQDLGEIIDEELAAVFTDCESIPQDLLKLLMIARNNGLIEGYPDGTFAPAGTITRAETAAVITRGYVLKLANDMNNDVDDGINDDIDDGVDNGEGNEEV
ncbi:MAG: S-layer homology domain-containing protein [Clostridiales bacterium]|jgi:hypothetical protein|nr:S-layer homology domain-containing protein [Clostridiales bacterium]